MSSILDGRRHTPSIRRMAFWLLRPRLFSALGRELVPDRDRSTSPVGPPSRRPQRAVRVDGHRQLSDGTYRPRSPFPRENGPRRRALSATAPYSDRICGTAPRHLHRSIVVRAGPSSGRNIAASRGQQRARAARRMSLQRPATRIRHHFLPTVICLRRRCSLIDAHPASRPVTPGPGGGMPTLWRVLSRGPNGGPQALHRRARVRPRGHPDPEEFVLTSGSFTSMPALDARRTSPARRPAVRAPRPGHRPVKSA